MTLEELIYQTVARAVREQAEALARPTHVTQRTVERLCGMPAADYLEFAREGAFPSYKVRRLVFAKTGDVIAYVEAHPVAAQPGCSATAQPSGEAAALARVGARRIAR